MNDNTPIDDDDFPEWVWDIVDKHDLSERTDSPLAGATVLLNDAADLLKDAVSKAFEEQALSSETLSWVNRCVDMIADAVKLSVLCDSTPEPGVVTKGEDGTLTWSPTDPA